MKTIRTSIVIFFLTVNVWTLYTQPHTSKIESVKAYKYYASQGLLRESRIKIADIRLVIDGITYDNPSRDSIRAHYIPHFRIVFAEVTARKDSKYQAWYLDHKIKYWLLRLNNTRYFRNVHIEYYNDEHTRALDRSLLDTSEQNILSVILVIALETRKTAQFWLENAYLGMSYRTPMGIVLESNLGYNRQDLSFSTTNLLISHKYKGFARIPFTTSIKVFHYLSELTTSWTSSTFYGAKATVGVRLLPSLELQLGASLVNSTTWVDRVSSDIVSDLGFPQKDSNGESYYGSTKLSFYIPLNEQGFYRSEIRVDIPAVLGGWNYQSSELELFDTYGIISSVTYAYKFGLYQALSVNVAGISNGMYETQPYYAKMNLLGGFFNDYMFEYNVLRRGSGYAYSQYIGSKGFSFNVKYGVLIYSDIQIGGIELSIFYDVGSVANSFDNVNKNIRHTLGPVLTMFWGEPFDMEIGASLNIGGSLLGEQPDGDSISFSIYAIPRF